MAGHELLSGRLPVALVLSVSAALVVVGAVVALHLLGPAPIQAPDTDAGLRHATFTGSEVSTGSIPMTDGSPAFAVADALARQPRRFGLAGFERATISDEVRAGSGWCYIVRIQPENARYVVRVTPAGEGWHVTGIARRTDEGPRPSSLRTR